MAAQRIFFNTLHHSCGHLYRFTIAPTIKTPQIRVIFVGLNSRRKHLKAAANAVYKARWFKLSAQMRTGPAFHTILQTFLSWSSIQGVCASPSLWKFPVSQSPESLTRSFAGWVKTQTPELSLSSPMRTTSGELRGMRWCQNVYEPLFTGAHFSVITVLFWNITVHLNLLFQSLSTVMNDV